MIRICDKIFEMSSPESIKDLAQAYADLLEHVPKYRAHESCLPVAEAKFKWGVRRVKQGLHNGQRHHAVVRGAGVS